VQGARLEVSIADGVCPLTPPHGLAPCDFSACAPKRVRRISGAMYLLLAVAGLIAVGTFPAATESGDQLVAWFREKAEGVRLFAWAWTVAIPSLAIMVASLRRLLPAPHRDVFLVGAISYLVAIEIGTWSWAGLALHVDGLNPATARTVLDVAIFLGPVLTGSTTTMMAPVTWLALLGQAQIPRWLRGFGTGRFFGAGGRDDHDLRVERLHAAGWCAMNMQLGATLTLGWLVAFGLWGGLRGHAKKTRRASSNLSAALPLLVPRETSLEDPRPKVSPLPHRPGESVRNRRATPFDRVEIPTRNVLNRERRAVLDSLR
jgi:hypothetical protein